MSRVAFLLAFVASGLAFWFTAPTASADHLIYLPLVPNTPLMQQIIRNQEYLWCVDGRAAAYPNFVTQLEDVNAQYAARVGIRSRQVAFTDPGCMVKHTMPTNIVCDGWAARIYYANYPVTVEYCANLGYFDWRSAQGHELGHGLLGLHEQYRDSGGTIGCDSSYQAMLNRLGYETVMSCGTGVRYPTARDVTLGCSIIATSWCGAPPPPCSNPCWNADLQRWVFLDGWSFEPARDWWFNPAGVPEWMATGCCNDRWNEVIKRWVGADGSFFDPATGIRSKKP